MRKPPANSLTMPYVLNLVFATPRSAETSFNIGDSWSDGNRANEACCSRSSCLLYQSGSCCWHASLRASCQDRSSIVTVETLDFGLQAFRTRADSRWQEAT
jgi:hypothetical protein